jgi:hypothetical protein
MLGGGSAQSSVALNARGGVEARESSAVSERPIQSWREGFDGFMGRDSSSGRSEKCHQPPFLGNDSTDPMARKLSIMAISKAC